MGRYAMNLNDGRMVFNTPAVAGNINFVEIDDDIHAAIKGGKMAWRTVANAVRAKHNNDPNFDWSKFDELRERLNVRKAKFELKDSGGHDVTGVGGEEKTEAINPSVSFVELNKVDAGGASTAGNTNVGAPSHHPAEAAAKPAKAAKAVQGVTL